MNKTVFHICLFVLVISSASSLVATAIVSKPAELVGILVYNIVLSSLLFVRLKRWDYLAFIGLLLLSLFGIVAFGYIGQIVYPMPPMSEEEAKIAIWLYGTRWVSLIWPFAVLVMGGFHFESEEKSKKKVPKAEPQKL